MAFSKKLTFFCLIALLLTFATFSIPILDAQQGAAPPKPGPLTATTNADFAAAADEVLLQMSEITG